MSRQARQTSSLGAYTVVLRGKTDCFKTAELQNTFLCCLYKYTSTDLCSVFAYAFSNKDCYLVVQEKNGSLSDFMRLSSGLFARLYNKNNVHIGKVFFDRYLSEPINSNDDIVTAIKQVLKLDVVDTYTSCKSNYFKNMFVDSSFVKERYSKLQWRQELRKPIEKANYKISVGKLTDEQVSAYILQKHNIKVTQINKLNPNLLESILREVVDVTKVSARQLARITSLPLRFLWKLVAKKDKKTETKDECVDKNQQSLTSVQNQIRK